MSDLSKKKSYIWKHFRTVSKDKAKCEYCLKVLSCSGGATGNLNRHIRLMHGTIRIEKPMNIKTENTIHEVASIALDSLMPLASDDLMPSTPTTSANPIAVTPEPIARQITQVPVKTRINAKSTRPLSVNKSKQIDEQIVKFIIKGYHAFSIVEEEEFKNIYKMILPKYSLPTRKNVSESIIPKLYQATKKKVLLQLTSADAVCLTTDCWTSMNNVNFISLTAHFINENSELKSVLIGCNEFDERKTGENLGRYLLHDVTEWGITHKITGVVTDNGPNVLAAVRFTGWRHFSCFAHDLNLVVSHSLESNIKELLEKVKAIVQYFKHSSDADHKLKAMQAQMELPPLKLKQSVTTRWNSTYDMLARIVKIKDAVVSTLAIEQPRLNTLTSDDWKVLEDSVKLLKVFYEVTEEISAEKSVSISKVIIFVKIMKEHIAKCLVSSNSEQCKQLLESLRYQLNDRFRDIEGHVLASEASFLDPRFKKHAFSSKEKYDRCLSSIRSQLRALIAQDGDVITQREELNDVQSQTQPTSSNLWSQFDKMLESDLIQDPTAASIIELDKYISEPLIKRCDDPLKWWHEHRLLYPHLYKLMKRRLCVTAKSAPSERIFSKADITINARRASLKPAETSQVLFLNYNL